MGQASTKDIIFSQFSKLPIPDQGASNALLGKGPLPDLQMAAFSLCPHIAIPLCVSSERGISDAPLLIKTPVLLD